MPNRACPIVLLLAALARLVAGESALPPGVVNSQKPGDVPSTPAESLALITAAPGFTVQQVAAEPLIAQPIALTFDQRGRLWVAESFSYKGYVGGSWSDDAKDRISILEDRDQDGRAEVRTVFTAEASRLSALVCGYGGVWACMAPNLVFIPDRNGDDQPDGPPEVVLDGFEFTKAGHRLVNGLIWGPDGWLYGLHGIQGISQVGVPGSGQRLRLAGGVWRYHPVHKLVEVVCEGTVNPWGLDFDDRGQAFMCGVVLAHLWHAIPGAQFERRYGQNSLPNSYELMKACVDHQHYAGGAWDRARAGKVVDVAGGGHAHAGLVVYQGDDFPANFRGGIFMGNLHGRRLNLDLPVRQGSGFTVSHGADELLRSADPWFRGVALQLGPDGALWLSDWADLGECHDMDGVHRDSGRIYRLSHAAKPPPPDLDLGKLDDSALVALHLHRNEWQVRTARRLLCERAAAGRPLAAAHAALRAQFADQPDCGRKLRALWTLHATGGIDEAGLMALLGHGEADVRYWAVRLIGDGAAPSDAALTALARRAKDDPAPLVRLGLASLLQRLPAARRWDIAEALVAHAEDADDANLPLMYWYGLEAAVAADAARAQRLIATCAIPKVRQFIVRRLASGDGK